LNRLEWRYLYFETAAMLALFVGAWTLNLIVLVAAGLVSLWSMRRYRTVSKQSFAMIVEDLATLRQGIINYQALLETDSPAAGESPE
jgi:hypothetical protein